ncbi:MAG: translocation/assembly module TamB domain-containing protein [Terriglobales bacterium]
MPRWAKIVAIVVAALVAVAGAGFGYLHTHDFNRRIEAFVSSQVRQATGARVTFAHFQITFRPLGVDARGVVVRGREGAQRPPLATIATVHAQVRVVHLFPPAIQILRARVAHPVLDVYYLPDGSTDLPQPPQPPSSTQPLAEPLFDFGIRQLTVRQGVLLYRNRQIPLNARLSGVRTALTYTEGHYQGSFAFRQGAIGYDGRPPLPQSAEVSFTLWPNDVRIDRLRWRGAGMRLTAHGMVQNLNQPRVRAHYELRINLARLAHWAAEPVVAGEAQAAGEFHWTVSAWSTHGQMQVRRLVLGRPWEALAGIGAGGPFQASNAGFALPALRITGGGGHGQLSVRYAGWRRLQVNGRVQGFHLERLLGTAAALGGPRLPSVLPPLAGVLSARLRFVATMEPGGRGLVHPRLTAQLRITPAPLSAPRPGARAPLPVSALITANASGGQWSAQIQHLDITGPDLRLRAAGHLSPAANRLAMGLTVPRLSAWRATVQPYLADLGASLPAIAMPPPTRWPLAGELRLQAEVRGSLAQPRVAVQIALAGFRLGPLAAHQLNFAAAVTAQQLTVRHAGWSLAGQSVALQGTLGLQHFFPSTTSALDLALTARHLQLSALEAQLHRWSRLRLPAAVPRQGRLQLRMAITGTVGQPHAAGPVSLRGARLDRAPLAASARLTLSRQQVAAGSVQVRLGAADIHGSAGYDWARRTFAAQLDGAGIQLAGIPVLQSPRLPLAGQVSFHLQASGPLSRPRGSLQVQATDLRGAGEAIGSLRATVSADGRSAHLQAMAGLPGGTVHLRAEVGEAAPYPLAAAADFQAFDVDSLLRRFTGVQVSGHNRVSGQASVQGPLARPQALAAQASLDPVQLGLGGVTLHNQGPIRITLANDVLALAQAHLIGADTDFSMAATLDLHAGGRLRGQALGGVNLALLHALDSTVHSSGQIALTATLGGTLRHPAVNGTLAVHHASLAQEQLPVAFDNVNGLVRFTGQQVAIEHLTAQTGGGRIALTGIAARTASGFTLALTAHGEGMRVRYQGLSGTGNLDLRLAGNQRQMLLSGDVELTRVALAPNFDFALFLANQRAAVTPPAANSWLDRVHLQVHVVTGPSVGIAISAARVSFQADLQVRGTLANPVLLGRITASQGEILFAGQDYTLSKAQVTFADPLRIQPLLDVSLTTTVQQYDITLNITGPADRLDITYRSDPPLTSSDIVALLATGQTQEAQNIASQQSTTGFAGQSEQLLGRAFESLVSSRLQRIFGVTQIQFNPNAQGFGPTAQTTVTIQQQVRRNLKITYTQNLTNSSEDIIRVDWSLTPELGITVSRGQFGLYGLSLHFSQRAR